MGTYQNLFNQVLATGVAGVALGQHTAAAREQAKESNIRTMAHLSDEKMDLTKGKLATEVEIDQATLSAADKITDIDKKNDASMNKYIEGKIKFNTLKSNLRKNEIAREEAIVAYAEKAEGMRKTIEGFNERIGIFNKEVEMAGKKYKKMFGEIEPIKEMKKIEPETLGEKVAKQAAMKMTPEEKARFEKLQNIKGGKK